jgi:hypothetical protein
MKADATRIEIRQLPSAEPYMAMARPHSAQRHVEGEPRSGRPPLTRSRSRSAPHFDVRLTTCASQADQDRLLAVIENCGAGFDAFNVWMHELLLSTNGFVPNKGVATTDRLLRTRVAEVRHDDVDMQLFLAAMAATRGRPEARSKPLPPAAAPP